MEEKKLYRSGQKLDTNFLKGNRAWVGGPKRAERPIRKRRVSSPWAVGVDLSGGPKRRNMSKSSLENTKEAHLSAFEHIGQKGDVKFHGQLTDFRRFPRLVSGAGRHFMSDCSADICEFPQTITTGDRTSISFM